MEHPRLSLRLLAEGGPVRLLEVTPGPEFAGAFDPAAYVRVHQPLVEVLTPAWGLDPSSNSGRHSGTHVGAGLRHVGRERSTEDGTEVLVVEQADAGSGLTTRTWFEVLRASP